MSDWAQNMIDWMEDPANEKRLSEIAKDFMDKQQARIEFFETDRFNELFEIIQKEDRVNDESLMYNTTIVEGLSYKDFCKVHYAVTQNIEEVDATDYNEEMTFPSFYSEYKGIRFYVMHGQGASCWTVKTELDEEEKIDAN
jgi:hypothetical protein